MTIENVDKYLKIALREAKRTSEFSDSYKKVIDDVQGVGSPKRTDIEPQRKSFTQKKASIFDYVKTK